MRAVGLVFVLGAFVLGTALFGQTLPALDAVLLVEDSIAATSLVRRSDLSSLGPDDRVAVMTFAGTQSLKLAFGADRAEAGRAIGTLDSREAPSTVRLLDAVAEAIALFDAVPDPSRRRAVFLVFSAEDNSSVQTMDGVRAALLRSQVLLSAATLSTRRGPSSIPRIRPVPARRNCYGPRPRMRRIRCYPIPTPGPQRPDVWDEGVPVSRASLLPKAASLSVEALVSESGGLMLKNAWSFTRLADHARSR